MKNKLLFLIIVGLFFVASTSCKKDKVVNKTINGMVINSATNEPVSNIDVAFSAVNDTRGGFFYVGDLWGSYKENHQLTKTDANGRFTFESVNFHSNPSYYYKIYTSSYSSLYNGRTEYSNDEVPVFSNDDGLDHILYVCPDLDFIYIKLDASTPILNSDSVNVVFSHKYKILKGAYPFDVALSNNQITKHDSFPVIQHQPMGWWYIKIYKYKNGVSLNVTDSIYSDYGSVNTFKLMF